MLKWALIFAVVDLIAVGQPSYFITANTHYAMLSHTEPRLGAINLHASRLPKFRGAAPINWAILAGETETGNSIIRLANRMDACYIRPIIYRGYGQLGVNPFPCPVETAILLGLRDTPAARS